MSAGVFVTGCSEAPSAEFGSQDGTPFNLRVARPKSVEVKGSDVNGKAHLVEVGWQ